MSEYNESNSNRTTSTLPSFLKDTRMKILLGALIVALALIAFGFASLRSLPDGMLYSVKTNLIEELNETVQATDTAKAQYQVTRMEARLDELKRLDQKGGLSDGAREDLTALANRHMQKLAEVAAIEGEEIPSKEMLKAVSDFSDVAAAIETYSEERESLTALGDPIEDIRRDAVNLYQDLVDRYAERESQENIFALVQELLGGVSQELGSGNISDDTLDAAETYLNRIAPAMAGGDYPRAITAIAEAKRIIMIERYGALLPEDTTTEPQDETGTTTPETTPTSTPETTPAATSSTPTL